MSRRLNEREVAAEASLIRDEDFWPNWPYLPVKNLYRRYDESLKGRGHGVIESSDLRTVVFVTIAELAPLATRDERFNAAERKTYDSTEDMIRDGWVGD